MDRKISNKILLKYFANLLIRNKFVVVLMIINTIIISIIPLLFLINTTNVNQSFKEYSLLNIAFPMIFLLLFNGGAIIVLFVKTKKNNIDLYIYIRPFKNSLVILSKQLIIWIFSFHLLIGEITGAMVAGFLGVDTMTVFLSSLGLIISTIIMSALWIAVLSFFPVFLNFMTSLISIFGVILFFTSASIIPLLLQQSQIIQTEFDLAKNKNNLLKIYQLDENSNTKNINYAIYENPLARNENEVEGWKPMPLINYSPFNVVWGIAPLISDMVVSSKLSSIELLSSNNRFSVNYLDIHKNLIDEKLFDGNQYIAGFTEKTVFDYKDKIELFKAIDQELMKNSWIKTNINNPTFWQTTLNELKKRNIWDNISENDKSMLLHIMGLNSATSILYSIFDNYNLISNKLDDLNEYLASLHNQYFSDFINYVWTNKNSRLNVYSYQTLGDYEEINNYHPILKTYDELEAADPYDLAFIENKLFNLICDDEGEIQKIQVLDSKEIYRDLTPDNVLNIFPDTIKTANDFHNYLQENQTINNLKALILKVKSQFSSEQIYPMEFRDNISNYYIVGSQLDVNEKITTKLQWLYVLVFLMLAFGLELIKYRKVMKGDIL